MKSELQATTTQGQPPAILLPSHRQKGESREEWAKRVANKLYHALKTHQQAMLAKQSQSSQWTDSPVLSREERLRRIAESEKRIFGPGDEMEQDLMNEEPPETGEESSST